MLYFSDSPSLDYSNKTKRHKRGAKVKPRKRENNPLTICDMIDALTYDYVSCVLLLYDVQSWLLC